MTREGGYKGVDFRDIPDPVAPFALPVLPVKKGSAMRQAPDGAVRDRVQELIRAHEHVELHHGEFDMPEKSRLKEMLAQRAR